MFIISFDFSIFQHLVIHSNLVTCDEVQYTTCMDLELISIILNLSKASILSSIEFILSFPRTILNNIQSTSANTWFIYLSGHQFHDFSRLICPKFQTSFKLHQGQHVSKITGIIKLNFHNPVANELKYPRQSTKYDFPNFLRNKCETQDFSRP